MTDPIADMLTRIRNANVVHHEKVELPSSKVKKAIALILKEEGFIRDLEVSEEGGKETLRLFLKYGKDKSRVITGIRRISRPGLRLYARKDQIPKVLGGLGVAMVSTSQGIMCDREARKRGLGGEVLLYIW